MKRRINKYIETRKRQQGGIVKAQSTPLITNPFGYSNNYIPVQNQSNQETYEERIKRIDKENLEILKRSQNNVPAPMYSPAEVEYQRKLAESNANLPKITQQKAPVPTAPMTVQEYNAALRVAEDEAREERYRNGGNFLDDALKGSMLGSGVNRFINGQNWYDIPLGMGQAALGTLMLAGGANMVAPRVSLKTSVPISPTTPKYTLLNSPTPFATKATNFGKSLLLGTTLDYTPKLVGDRTMNEIIADQLFSKETQNKYPISTSLGSGLINPSYYLGFGAKGLEYTGALGKQLTNGISNTVTRAKNWRMTVPSDENRYYRIVGHSGDAIVDAIESGVIRGPGMNPLRRSDFLPPKNGTITLLRKYHNYPMFAKGHPWAGSTANADKGKPYIIRSKKDTGPIIWEKSNVDFNHKGHKGIYRPSYYGDINAAPTQFFEYWEPKLLGYMRKDFPKSNNPYANFLGNGCIIDRGGWESSLGIIGGSRFGDYIGSGSEQTVF